MVKRGSSYCSVECSAKGKLLVLPPLTTRQTEIVNGSLLGDGYLAHIKKGNSFFGEVHAARFKEYLDWMSEELGEWSKVIRWRKPMGYSGPDGSYVFTTKQHVNWTELRHKWYPKNKKIVPTDLTLTPLTLATWYCGDGSNEQTRGFIRFCTDGFPIGCVELLKDKLKDTFNIIATIQFNNKQPRLAIGTRYYNQFMEIVTPHVVCDCFKYKVEISERTKSKKSHWRSGKLRNPDGQVFEFDSIVKFAKEHGLCRHAIGGLLRGQYGYKSYKGWTVA